ncbi:MAG: CCA tRNA nucleotidyltransferase [Gammaproteobacteria bacterium]|nr:CCA tRNA nucleotidyltransferase [Gammaproteobacteria bacterium]
MENDNKLLAGAIKIITKLNEKGYEAYMVGGFVRDYQLGMEGKDIDITTNALPNVVQELFPNNFSKSLKFKTVNVREGDYVYEITTYRVDKSYKDHRHPESKVSLSLKEDVKRRDFTVNAMCMDKDLNLIDYVGGINDLKLHILRCVGSPKRRFNEDALRMFRAFRFASRLDFKIDSDTFEGIRSNANLVKYLSKERIRAELEETVESPYFKSVLPLMLESGIFKSLPDIDEALGLIDVSYKPFTYMDLMVLASYLKGAVTDDLLFTKKERRFVEDAMFFMNLLRERRLTPFDIFDRDTQALYEAQAALSLIKSCPYTVSDLDELVKNLPIMKAKDLNITGNDIKDALQIEDSKDIKEYLIELEKAVIYYKVENDTQKLVEYLKGIIA